MRHAVKKHEGLNGMLLDNVRYYNNQHMAEHTLIPTKMSLDALVCKRTYCLSFLSKKDSSLKKSEQYLYLMRGLITAYKRFFSPPIRHHLFPSTLLLVPIYEGEAQALIWLI